MHDLCGVPMHGRVVGRQRQRRELHELNGHLLRKPWGSHRATINGDEAEMIWLLFARRDEYLALQCCRSAFPRGVRSIVYNQV